VGQAACLSKRSVRKRGQIIVCICAPPCADFGSGIAINRARAVQIRQPIFSRIVTAAQIRVALRIRASKGHHARYWQRGLRGFRTGNKNDPLRLRETYRKGGSGCWHWVIAAILRVKRARTRPVAGRRSLERLYLHVVAAFQIQRATEYGRKRADQSNVTECLSFSGSMRRRVRFAADAEW